MPDSPIVDFSPQEVMDLRYPGARFAGEAKVSPSPSGAGSLPPFSVLISIVYVVALLGTGVYFLLHTLLAE